MYIWRSAIAIKEGKEENLFERSTQFNTLKLVSGPRLWWILLTSKRILEVAKRRNCFSQLRISASQKASAATAQSHSIAVKRKVFSMPFHCCHLICQFPQNALISTTCDQECNICLMNGNPGKLFKAINQVVSKRKQTLLVSCCDLACMSMCASENVIPSALVMWNPGCGRSRFKDYPNSLPHIPSKFKKPTVSFSQ